MQRDDSTARIVASIERATAGLRDPKPDDFLDAVVLRSEARRRAKYEVMPWWQKLWVQYDRWRARRWTTRVAPRYLEAVQRHEAALLREASAVKAAESGTSAR